MDPKNQAIISSILSALGASNRDFREPLNHCITKEEIDFSTKSIDPMTQIRQKSGEK